MPPHHTNQTTRPPRPQEVEAPGLLDLTGPPRGIEPIEPIGIDLSNSFKTFPQAVEAEPDSYALHASFTTKIPNTVALTPPITGDTLTSIALVGAGIAQFGGKLVAGITSFFAVATSAVQLWTCWASRSAKRRAVAELAERAVSTIKSPKKANIYTGDPRVDNLATQAINGAAIEARRAPGKMRPLVAIGQAPFTKPVIWTLASELNVGIIRIKCGELVNAMNRMPGFIKELEAKAEKLEAEVEQADSSRRKGVPHNRRRVRAVIVLEHWYHLCECDKATFNSLVSRITGSPKLGKRAILVAPTPSEPKGALGSAFLDPLRVSVPAPTTAESLANWLRKRFDRLALTEKQALNIAEVFKEQLYTPSTIKTLAELNNRTTRASGFDQAIQYIVAASRGPGARPQEKVDYAYSRLNALAALTARFRGVPVLGFSLRPTGDSPAVYQARPTEREGGLGESGHVSPTEAASELVLAFVRSLFATPVMPLEPQGERQKRIDDDPSVFHWTEVLKRSIPTAASSAQSVTERVVSGVSFEERIAAYRRIAEDIVATIDSDIERMKNQIGNSDLVGTSFENLYQHFIDHLGQIQHRTPPVTGLAALRYPGGLADTIEGSGHRPPDTKARRVA